MVRITVSGSIRTDSGRSANWCRATMAIRSMPKVSAQFVRNSNITNALTAVLRLKNQKINKIARNDARAG
jgi:hypothetical protein